MKPLETALCQSVPEIHHSDQGVQYLSNAYISLLRHHDIEISVARRGCPWENGYAERLIRTLKEEEVHLNAYDDIHEARARIGHFITQVYNHKRPIGVNLVVFQSVIESSKGCVFSSAFLKITPVFKDAFYVV